MRRTLVLRAVASLTVLTCTLACEPSPQGTPLTVDDLLTKPVAGRLGRPLGTVVQIEAEVFRGSDLNTKGDVGTYLLRVTSVDGKALPKPELMHFGLAPGSPAKLASETFGLWRMKKGSESRGLYPGDAAEVEKGYVGRRVRLWAYETGGYSGIPPLNPRGRDDGPDVMIWQDHAFGFSTSLVVLAEVAGK